MAHAGNRREWAQQNHHNPIEAAGRQKVRGAHPGSPSCAPPAPPAPGPPQTAPPASRTRAHLARRVTCLAAADPAKQIRASLLLLPDVTRLAAAYSVQSSASCYSLRTSLEPCRLQVLLMHTCSVCLTGKLLPLAEQVVRHAPACVHVLFAAGSARYAAPLFSCLCMLPLQSKGNLHCSRLRTTNENCDLICAHLEGQPPCCCWQPL